MKISEDAIKNAFFFALPSGLDISQRSDTEWIVKFPGESDNFTLAAMESAAKDRPWCKCCSIICHYLTLDAYVI
jgi:hypothetical protein